LEKIIPVVAISVIATSFSILVFIVPLVLTRVGATEVEKEVRNISEAN
jgi:hypothetical protein